MVKAQKTSSLRRTLKCGYRGFHPKNVVFGFLLMFFFCHIHISEAKALKFEDLMTRMKVSAADQKKMLAGEVIAYKRVPTSDTELGITLAFFVPVPMSYLPKTDFGKKLAAIDRTVLEYTVLPQNAGIEDFKGLGWRKNTGKETEWLLEAEPGERFNLSPKEIQTLEKLKKTESSKAALKAYHNLLFNRFRAFVDGGLGKVAPYVRSGGDLTYPGKEIQRGFARFADFLQVLPGFSKAVIDYPLNQPENLKETFYVENQWVEDRPTFVLGRRVWRLSSENLIMAETQYYVGHSYNGMLAMRGAFAVENGVFVFYTNRTFTDQISGFGSGMKRSIGLSMHKKALIEDLKNIRDHMVRQYQNRKK